ncbi:CaiB/BaiF CoA transferase family protein [Cryptosporangium aurantiacum]|uniref:Crotonobetainyl-CoA:carnitine CoA-transferase CaiB n=1 Tax=Cryptosporangium aurantiacum TaxID=134849 RepID=A0A1M7PIQ0_9ACTN|nr:CoA transferase [Cryptosporangium aurantiacum]SHN17047.1 Crotonobetainyl-CoA:carnitine CoA-transferase CaiB [Cryptosporangium aurantiacum]
MSEFAGVPIRQPLAGVRVLDLTDGSGELCGRYLADLGADVVLLEPPGGAGARRKVPLHQGVSLYFAAYNANKRGITLDLRDDRDAFLRLVDAADLLIESGRPGELAAVGLGPDELRARNPRVIVVSITDFGQDGPYRDWVATDWTQLAMGGVLARNGLPGLPPLMPPGHLAGESAALQAAWAALVAYRNRLDTGVGDHVDAAVYEMTAQVVDPGYGIAGSATGGVPAPEMPRGRPDARHLYPIFPCADGYVRICLLAKRQWRGMFTWLGEPAEFADPKYDATHVRFRAAKQLYALIGDLFRDRSRDELVAEGQRHGVPIAALLSPGEVLHGDHFAVRGGFVDAEIAAGLSARMPTGPAELDGVHAGFRHRAPAPGEHTAAVLAEWQPRPTPEPAPVPGRRRPLAGLRVLDLGVIVVGAELGRLLADQGADVIKVENRAFPDGSRQSARGERLSVTFAWGHRNKRSLGLDLRSPEGANLFRRLATDADVILSNFKPGTLESLGLGYTDLKALNPRLIMADSSALGSTGPWAKRMGYGPLVRASVGLTELWRYPDVEGSFSDASTIYPDHIAARVGATAVLALLIERVRTGTGGTVSIAQAETTFTQFAPEFLRESLEPATFRALGNAGEWNAPYGVYPCLGEDEWCAITVRTDDDWQRLCGVLGRLDWAADPALATAAGRIAAREKLDAQLAEWTATLAPREVMALLQDAGVPAGAMQRLTEYPADPQLAARGFLRPVTHPFIGHEFLTEAGPARFEHVAEPELRPAPLAGQHTREIARELLGLDDARIEALLAAGVLEESEISEGEPS